MWTTMVRGTQLRLQLHLSKVSRETWLLASDEELTVEWEWRPRLLIVRWHYQFKISAFLLHALLPFPLSECRLWLACVITTAPRASNPHSAAVGTQLDYRQSQTRRTSRTPAASNIRLASFEQQHRGRTKFYSTRPTCSHARQCAPLARLAQSGFVGGRTGALGARAHSQVRIFIRIHQMCECSSSSSR